jgi:hypothetical protein
MDTFDLNDLEAKILVAWHSTAANFWQYGEFHDLDGPAAEVNGKPCLIEREFQLGIDEYGNPFMRHFLVIPGYTLRKFDVGGVTLRDVTIRYQGDRIGYSIPDTVDQGGAVRQFRLPLGTLLSDNELSKPVLKSDIQAAVETHAKEGGLSE